MKIYNISEVFIVANDKKGALEKYLERQMGITGEDISEFNSADIVDALTPFFEAVAERFDTNVSYKYTEKTGLRVPKITFEEFPIGEELTLEIDDDRWLDINEGYILKVVLRGKEENEIYVSVIDYIDDIDAMEHEIREEVSRLVNMSKLLE